MRPGKSKWWIASALFIAGLACYWSTHTRYAYLWDSVEFVEAIRNFNVGLSQPHPPGYFLYVMLGRAVNLVVGDPHVSLVGISVVAGAGLTAVVFCLGERLAGRAAGVAAGLVTLTSPLVWFFSSVALTYVVDALLVCGFVWACYEAARRGGSGWVAMGLGIWLGVIGGVRQQSFFGLVPVVGYALWQFRPPRWTKFLVAALAAVVVSVVWISTMLDETGGWEVYRAALRQITQFHAHKTLAGGGWSALRWNIFFAGLYCCNALLLAALAVPVGLQVVKGRWLLWWALPVFLLAVGVGYTEAPGHIFTYLPVLLILAGAGLARIGKWAVTVPCLVNVLVFLAWPPAWSGVMWGTLPRRQVLVEHDRLVADTVALIRSRYNPSDTIILHEHGDLYFGLRHFQLYLPEFANYRIDPDLAMVPPPGKPLVCARGEDLIFVSEIPKTGWRYAIHVRPPGSRVDGTELPVVAGSNGVLLEQAR